MGVASSIVACVIIGLLFRDNFTDAATTAGMLAGVYIGGTPNMVAVSKALNANEQLFITLNATDTICSGLYFFFLISFGKVLIGKFLPPFHGKSSTREIHHDLPQEIHHPFPPRQWNWVYSKPLLIALLITSCSIAISVILAFLLPDVRNELNQTVLMLTLTTIGIGLSFFSKLRSLSGVYAFAQYLLLIFGLSAGYMSDFSSLISTGSDYLSFNAIVICIIIALHFVVSFPIRADTDSFMISSTACILGPPFVAQVAGAIKNKELLPVGIAFSLLGLGLGNYAGILVAWIINN